MNKLSDETARELVKNTERLYGLSLFESHEFNSWGVTRVPGGWIMYFIHSNNDAPTFVPFNNDFQYRAEKAKAELEGK